jgi:Tfp pilus assembly protein PilF
MAKTKAAAKTVKTRADKPFYQKNAFELIVVVFALLLFANSLGGGYNMDDELVTRNHRLTSKGISAIPEIFTSPYYQDNMGYAYEYRPIPLSTFAVEYSMFGDSAAAGHFFNWVLYALLCFCLYRLLATIGGRISPLLALCTVLLFCAHPSHTEVVSSIKNRDEILGLLFCVLGMNTAINAARKNTWWRLLISGALFLLAMLCKTTFIPFAFLIPLSIILFAESSLAFAALTALLTGVVSYFTLNLNPDYYRLWFVLAMVAAVIVAHLVVKKSFDLSGIPSLFRRKEETVSPPDEPFSGLKGWLSGFDASVVIAAIPTLVILLLYNFLHPGMLSTAGLITLIAIATGALYLRGKNYLWLGAFNIAVCIFIGLASIGGFDTSVKHPLAYALYVCLLFLFWWGMPLLRIPALLAALAIAVNFFFDTRSGYVDAFLFLLLSRLAFGRRVIWAILLVEVGVFSMWAATGKLSNGEQVIHLAGIVQFVLLLLLANWKDSLKLVAQRANLVAGVISLAIAGIMFFNHSHDVRIGAEQAVRTKPLPNIVESLVETKTERPIDFVEFPVATNDPARLRAGTAMIILGHYLVKLVVPYPLSFYYGYSYIKPTDISSPMAVVVFIVLLLLAGVTVFFIRRDRYISFALAIIMLSLLVFSGYFMPVPGIVGDRYLLIPSIGWSILVTLLLFKVGKVVYTGTSPWTDNFRLAMVAKPVAYGFFTILTLYSVSTFARNFDWKDDLTLMRHDVKAVPEAAQAHNLLALHLMQHSTKSQNQQEKTDLAKEALAEFKKAKEIYPPFFNATYDIARVYLELQMPDSAVQTFKQVIALEPKFSESYAQIADIYMRKDIPDSVIVYLELFLQKRPTDFAAYDKLSYIYFRVLKFDKSIAVNQRAVQMFPQRPEPLTNIGQTYLTMNKLDSARVYCQRALAINPNYEIAKVLQRKLGGQ